MKVVIVGAGLIGNKRASALDKEDKLVAVCDTYLNSAKILAEKYNAVFTDDLQDIAHLNGIDVAIISVVNKYISPIAIDMLKSGKNVLCEKPLGMNFRESKNILDVSKIKNKLVKTGFNHRYHPALQNAKKLIAGNKLGKILNIRARYGHGGRPSMENEWRSSMDLCGGGELIDQGVHLIDLCRWFLGDVVEVSGKTSITFWPIEVEDNAHFLLTFDGGQYAQCHVSWTNWKNIFSFEIFGTDGYLEVNGLGGSYGPETLTIGMRNIHGGAPVISQQSFHDEDKSWEHEWREFKNAVLNKSFYNGTGTDGYEANRVIGAIYKSSNEDRTVKISEIV